MPWPWPRIHHAERFGVLEVSVLHKVLHLVFVVVGVLACRWVGASALFLVWWVYGLIVDEASWADLLPPPNRPTTGSISGWLWR